MTGKDLKELVWLSASLAIGIAGSHAVVALAKAFMMAVAMGNM